MEIFLQPHAAVAIPANEFHAGMLQSDAHTVDRRRIDLLRLTNASTHYNRGLAAPRAGKPHRDIRKCSLLLTKLLK